MRTINLEFTSYSYESFVERVFGLFSEVFSENVCFVFVDRTQAHRVQHCQNYIYYYYLLFVLASYETTDLQKSSSPFTFAIHFSPQANLARLGLWEGGLSQDRQSGGGQELRHPHRHTERAAAPGGGGTGRILSVSTTFALAGLQNLFFVQPSLQDGASAPHLMKQYNDTSILKELKVDQWCWFVNFFYCQVATVI